MATIISGVYVITNSINGKRYIGSSANTRGRKNDHFFLLRQGKHPNPHLQNAYCKHGRKAFTFQILEKCGNSLLIEREQYYIDALRPEYNIRLIASSNLGLKRSDESRKRISDGHKGQVAWNKGKQLSEEYRQKLSRAKKGKVLSSEHRQNISNAMNGVVHSIAARLKLSDAHKGKKQSEEHRKKNSESHKGQIPWNKGLSYKIRRRVSRA